MPELKNFVAVDWRAGKDKIYFFFKDSNTYSRFDIANDTVEDGYPKPVTAETWGDFHPFAKHLKFGFATAGIDIITPFDWDSDTLWLFYYDNDVPTVCKYDQDDDQVEKMTPMANSIWHPLVPYFDRIVAGTFNATAERPRRFTFLLDDGHFIVLDLNNNFPPQLSLSDKPWPGLAPYKDRVITAVQNDRTILSSHYYVFLTHNEYLRYDLPGHKLLAGPIRVSEVTWPGLLRD